MKRIAFYLFCCLSAVLFVACGGDPVTPGGKDKISSITGEATHISCRNAVIAGKANLPANTSPDLKIGVLYSSGSGVIYGSSTAIEATTFDSDFNYTITTETLEPETKYYYRSYILQNNEVTYGDTKSFTTLPVSSMIETGEVTDIEAAVATLHGKLDLTDCRYDALEYGFKLTPQGGQETTLKSSDLSDKTFSVKAEGLSFETSYEVVTFVSLDGRTYVAESKPFTTLPAGAVDMGLSVLWHQCNIGASKPEEYGDYYAWGETMTKSTYSWSTYTLCSGSENTMTKYCPNSSYGTVDNKTVLDPEDDVAHVKLGGKWRMPTDTEWTELRNTSNCTWTWTTVNGVEGMLVTSKKTGNSIFLPAAGFRFDDNLFSPGFYGDYWSSSLAVHDPIRAEGVSFNSYSGNVGRSYIYRYDGQSVRPVCNP